jgi:hypothetical protein
MLSAFAVILIPSFVILIPQSREKNLRSSLRVNPAKDLCSSTPLAKQKRQLRRFFVRQ